MDNEERISLALKVISEDREELMQLFSNVRVSIQNLLVKFGKDLKSIDNTLPETEKEFLGLVKDILLKIKQMPDYLKWFNGSAIMVILLLIDVGLDKWVAKNWYIELKELIDKIIEIENNISKLPPELESEPEKELN